MPIACVLVTHLPVKLEMLRQPALRGRPVLIVTPSASQRTVLDRSAEAKGVTAGMMLEHALACCPEAMPVEADVSAYRGAWGHMLDALEQRSPIVEDTDLGHAYVDLAGLDRLYGNEANLLRAIIGAVPRAYSPRVGIAESKFPAFAAALRAEPVGAFRVPTQTAAFLAPLPVALLPTSWEIKERLIGFGLQSMGDMAALPFAAMQAEFGKEGARLWRLANGRDDEPVTPRSHEEQYVFQAAFAAPTASLPAILVTAESLVTRAFRHPRLRGRYIRAALLQGAVSAGEDALRLSPGQAPTWSKRVVFREPAGSRDQAFLAIRMSLDNLALPGLLETLSLTLAGITGEAGRQESLFWDVRRVEQMDEALRQLEVRLGRKPPIYRVREVEPWSRIPERRLALLPYEP